MTLDNFVVFSGKTPDNGGWTLESAGSLYQPQSDTVTVTFTIDNSDEIGSSDIYIDDVSVVAVCNAVVP